MEDTFVLADVPGKGKGLLAARRLSRGDLVLAESPLFTQSRGFTVNTLISALSQLSRDDQRAYFFLSNAFPELSPPLGVWMTNSFPCWSPEDPIGLTANTAGVFLHGSRFNGSCQPNVYHCLDPNLRQMVFRAVRDIDPGEELCITYSDLFAPRDQRQVELKEAFRFDCCCTACSRTGEELRLSDERREKISLLFYDIPRHKEDLVLGMRTVKMALQLLKEEGLLGSASESFYADGLAFCAAASDIPNTKLWAQKLVETHTALAGRDSEAARNSQEYVLDPQAHPSFGTGQKMELSGPDI